MTLWLSRATPFQVAVSYPAKTILHLVHFLAIAFWDGFILRDATIPSWHWLSGFQAAGVLASPKLTACVCDGAFARGPSMLSFALRIQRGDCRPRRRPQGWIPRLNYDAASLAHLHALLRALVGNLAHHPCVHCAKRDGHRYAPPPYHLPHPLYPNQRLSQHLALYLAPKLTTALYTKYYA